MKGELRDYILQSLEGEFIKKNFDENVINKVKEKLMKGNIKNYHNSLVVWTLFALEKWYEQYL